MAPLNFQREGAYDVAYVPMEQASLSLYLMADAKKWGLEYNQTTRMLAVLRPASVEPAEVTHTTCKNCGAPKPGWMCDYCRT